MTNTMMKLFAFLLVYFFASCSLTAAVQPCECKPKYKKQHVTTEELVVSNQGIFFIDSNKTIRETPGVFSDDEGLFVMVPQYWYCPDCHRDHWGACPRDF